MSLRDATDKAKMLALGGPKQIQEKVTALVYGTYGGDNEAAFNAFDADQNRVIDERELAHMLNTAAVSIQGFDNERVAEIMMQQMNTDGQAGISWTELQAVLEAG